MTEPDARLTHADARRLIANAPNALKNQRQRDVFAYWLAGHTRRQTAHEMRLSTSTVQAHLDNAIRILIAADKEPNA